MQRHNLIADLANEGSRLDRFVIRHNVNLDFARVAQMLRKGLIKLNGKKSTGSARIQEGDIISVPSFILSDDYDIKPDEKSKGLFEFIKQFIILEDENLIAINKPANIAVQGGTNIDCSIADAILHFTKDSRIVHRLDRDTSGVLLIAKSLAAAQDLGELFAQKKVSKCYYAIICGNLPNKRGTISKSLLKGAAHNMEKMLHDEDGLQATTRYEVLDSNNQYSLVLLQPITGRKHQLRAHMALMNCPVLGDKKYADSKIARGEKLFLHAYSIAFKLGKEYSIKAEIPEYFRNKMKQLDLTYRFE